MYQARTVFTGSEMPALRRIGGGTVDCCAAARRGAANKAEKDNVRKERFVRIAGLPPTPRASRSRARARPESIITKISAWQRFASPGPLPRRCRIEYDVLCNNAYAERPTHGQNQTPSIDRCFCRLLRCKRRPS